MAWLGLSAAGSWVSLLLGVRLVAQLLGGPRLPMDAAALDQQATKGADIGTGWLVALNRKVLQLGKSLFVFGRWHLSDPSCE